MAAAQKSKRLYIIRHGETDYNRQGMVQGRGIDASLNEQGRRQAAAFHAQYRGHSFEKAYVSEMKRTKESISNFIDDGLAYEKLAGLDEISWGSQEGVRFSEDTKQEYMETIQQWRNGNLTRSVAGGESPIDVMLRQKEAMAHILAGSEQEVLICMHGRAIRILMAWLLNYDLSLIDHFPHTNLGLYQLLFSGRSFRVERINDNTHLKNL